MPNSTPHQEIEIKLRVNDLATLRSRLKRLGAREISPRTHEFNTLYDTPRLDLKRRGQLIRIRIEQPAANFGRKRPNQNAPAILTYKGPSQVSRGSGRTGTHTRPRGHFKIKEETEASVPGANEVVKILRVLGFHPVFRYEKFRTTHALPGIRGLKIELDETPVGIFLELEGPPPAINRAARLLGYTSQDYLKATYGALYLADCRKRGRKPSDMLFPPRKKLH